MLEDTSIDFMIEKLNSKTDLIMLDVLAIFSAVEDLVELDNDLEQAKSLLTALENSVYASSDVFDYPIKQLRSYIASKES